jgi:RNA polymerase-associated protein CTR9
LETLRHALKCFEDALRLSGDKNIMATLGKARVQFSMGKYAEALQIYQKVLERAPHMVDPDPRIGIGCCLWQLNHREDAKVAWERALEKNPGSKFANILVGIYFLQYSSQFATTEPEFRESYKKAMSVYAQTAFKIDGKMSLACSTFAGFFLSQKRWGNMEILARKAIEQTDINAIASDGWYLLARKEHHEENYPKANEYYIKSDQARGGDDRGYLPAKFGAAQIRVLMQDFDNAKFRLEKLVQQSKSIEAITLLGTLYAEDVFAVKLTATNKEEVANQRKKAITALEQVRLAWKDPKKKVAADASILLNLARLYELDAPEKSLQCLLQVEQMEIDAIPKDLYPNIEDEATLRQAIREHIPAPLLNNIGCFHYQAGNLTQAKDIFQTALNACVKIGDDDPLMDTDALVTTISYNLARTYEADGLLDEAQKVYEGLLARHPDYMDAIARLAHIAYLRNPEEGAKEMHEMFDNDTDNLDIRGLYGWFLNRTKRRTLNFADDQEQRHNKQTLVNFDKYDPYVLTSMGNICLSIAREMRREDEKEKRRKTYERAVEFFDRALSIDPKNAYAAQGVGIAMAEDKKDILTALQIFNNVRETLKDATVFMNLGHAYCELKQYARAIENYEYALAKKDRVSEVAVLTCLGRVWLMKGRHEKDLKGLKYALDYSQRALELVPDQIHFRFNVAFVQIQIAQLICNIPSVQRTLIAVEKAATDLDTAIETLFAVAKEPQPPFPRHDLEQRANMGRNTIKKQVDRALEDQRKYEETNASKLAAAREQREAELRKREEAKQRAQEEADERKGKIAEERKKMEERDRELVAQRAEQERLLEEAEMTTDEMGERVKRTKKPRGGGGKRKKKVLEDDFISDGHYSSLRSTADEGTEAPPKSKRRRLERADGASRPSRSKPKRASKKSGKYKSSEMILDSDEEAGLDDGGGVANGGGSSDVGGGLSSAPDTPAAISSDGEESVVERRVTRRKVAKRVIDEDDDDDGEEANGAGNGDVSMSAEDDEDGE